MQTKQIAIPRLNNQYIVCLLSGQGSTGKTVITSNLSLQSSLFYPSLLIDADLGMDSIRTNFLPEQQASLAKETPSIVSYLNGVTQSLTEIVTKYPVQVGSRHAELMLMPGSLDQVASTHRMELLIRDLGALKRTITIIDGGAGTDNPGFAFHASADMICIVVTDSRTAVDDAASVIETICKQYNILKEHNRNLRFPALRLICNKITDPQQVAFIVQRLNVRLSLRSLPTFGKNGANDVHVIPFIPQLREYAEVSHKLLITDPNFNKINDGENNPAIPFLRIFWDMVQTLASLEKPRPASLLSTVMQKMFSPTSKAVYDVVNIENIKLMEELLSKTEILNVLRNGKTRMVNSGKAGVGKTTAIAHEAELLAEKGQKVCIVELSRQQNAAYTHYATHFGVKHVLTPVALDVALPTALADGVDLLFFRQDPDMAHGAYVRRIIRVLQNLNETYDRIIIDCPSGIVIRNVLLNMLVQNVDLFMDATDPESRNKNIQYLKRLALLNIELGGGREQIKVSFSFSMVSKEYGLEQCKHDLSSILAALTPEEREVFAFQRQVMILPYSQLLAKRMSCGNRETEGILLLHDASAQAEPYVQSIKQYK